MDSDNYTFRISQSEIKRRKKAYLTLFSSLFLGFAFTTSVLDSIDFSSGLVLLTAFAVMFGLLGFLAFASFRAFAKMVVSLNSQILERITDKTREICLLTGIESIFVKRTSYGNIREMRITQKNGVSFFVNALQDFEMFYEKLKDYVGAEVEVKSFSELINYDHGFFYVFFGLLIGFSTPLLMSVLISLDAEDVWFVFYAVSLFLVVLGVIFVMTKPFSKRYGNHKRSADFLFGAAVIIVGCFVLFR